MKVVLCVLTSNLIQCLLRCYVVDHHCVKVIWKGGTLKSRPPNTAQVVTAAGELPVGPCTNDWVFVSEGPIVPQEDCLNIFKWTHSIQIWLLWNLKRTFFSIVLLENMVFTLLVPLWKFTKIVEGLRKWIL